MSPPTSREKRRWIRELHRAGWSQRRIRVEVATSFRAIRAVVREWGTFQPFLGWEPGPGRLRLDERDEIALGLAKGESFSAIARRLGRVTSTVSREAHLGHRDLKMTLVDARIADRKVADEYFAVTQQVEALYTTNPPVLPATAEGAAMRRLRQELQRRDVGNGYCTRPANTNWVPAGAIQMTCAFETVCETCVHFATGPEFVPVLVRQRNHAAERDHTSPSTSMTGSCRASESETRTGRVMPVKNQLDRITGIIGRGGWGPITEGA